MGSEGSFCGVKEKQYGVREVGSLLFEFLSGVFGEREDFIKSI